MALFVIIYFFSLLFSCARMSSSSFSPYSEFYPSSLPLLCTESQSFLFFYSQLTTFYPSPLILCFTRLLISISALLLSRRAPSSLLLASFFTHFQKRGSYLQGTVTTILTMVSPSATINNPNMTIVTIIQLNSDRLATSITMQAKEQTIMNIPSIKADKLLIMDSLWRQGR